MLKIFNPNPFTSCGLTNDGTRHVLKSGIKHGSGGWNESNQPIQFLDATMWPVSSYHVDNESTTRKVQLMKYQKTPLYSRPNLI